MMIPAALLATMLPLGPLPVYCEGDRYNFDHYAMYRCLQRHDEQVEAARERAAQEARRRGLEQEERERTLANDRAILDAARIKREAGRVELEAACRRLHAVAPDSKSQQAHICAANGWWSTPTTRTFSTTESPAEAQAATPPSPPPSKPERLAHIRRQLDFYRKMLRDDSSNREAIDGIKYYEKELKEELSRPDSPPTAVQNTPPASASSSTLPQPPAVTADRPLVNSGARNLRNDYVLSLSQSEQAALLGKGVPCTGTFAFYQGMGLENKAYWSLQCSDGKSYGFEIAPNAAESRVLECSVLNAMPGVVPCFKKFSGQ
jgi:hypothetical protein